MNILLTFTVILSAIPVMVYMIYIFAAITSKPKQYPPLKSLPEISIIIPTYNEGEVIEHRIQNLAKIDYPVNKMNIIIVDDQSNDDTVEKATSAFEKYHISGEIIQKKIRTGTNASVNLGVEKAKTQIVITTDADVTFERSALKTILSILTSDEKIGAVCGELQPIAHKQTFTTGNEKAYRSIYGKICTWESNVDSTYCFNGPLIALKKKAFSPIPVNSGASDAGMALQIIKNGYKCIYSSGARFHEYITSDLKQQIRQKIRRSARLLEATFYNIGLVNPKYGKFGMIVFPLRILMFIVVPISFFISLILWSYILLQINLSYTVSLWALLIIALATGIRYPNLISSFIWHQIYLVASIPFVFRGMSVWNAIERKKV
ncbi:glycosyltransferase [Methanococcoides sp. SA1]|nr:glycosyltransferase [Methanococcoides sp. SA1]